MFQKLLTTAILTIVLSMLAMFATTPATFAASIPHENAASSHTVTGHPTPLIEQVTCGTRTDWLRIFTSNGSEYCFANAGTMNITINNPTEICGGNNAGAVYAIESNGDNVIFSFYKNQCVTGFEFQYIYAISIS